MPTVVIERPIDSVPMEPPLRKRWTRAECAVLEASGLWDNQHLELVDGEVINKMGKGRRHSESLTAVFAWLILVFGEARVNSEATIDVAPEDDPTSEPEPDLIVFAGPSWDIPNENPRPDDLRLVIEISDATLHIDLNTKAALYARAGIVEYWVVDIPGRRIFVHRDPREGRYQSIKAYSDKEAVSPLAAPEHEFRVAQAFPGRR